MTGADLLVVAFKGLSDDEQEEAFERLGELRLGRLAAEDSTTGRMIRSLRIVQERVGGVPTVDEYREQYRQLKAVGTEIEETSCVIRHFGSWRKAKEALELSGGATDRQIDARFRERRLGKIWRYREETLRRSLEAASDYWSEADGLDYRRAISVAEYEWWRERELERARAAGDDARHIPGHSVFWHRHGKRNGGWAAVLRHFGWEDEEIERRLEDRSGRFGTPSAPRQTGSGPRRRARNEG